jgi:hypothetical protein
LVIVTLLTPTLEKIAGDRDKARRKVREETPKWASKRRKSNYAAPSGAIR